MSWWEIEDEFSLDLILGGDGYYFVPTIVWELCDWGRRPHP